ncbi:low affinity immunoglobulin gamma Fc region receptor II-like [Myripristis murdjan]|uniref:low affinity immunoglobulin gamma Fc region receptor II-like n=1 Tax=Myripristis murdjan TaxID=586833 RepID=UPI0011760B84|nr:low affinity immunoglobulin gamma Fc region receptor II-like [Myripristis murdjan]
MEVTAVCLTLVMKVLLLRSSSAQNSDLVSLHVDPSRLQLFLYESVSFSCEGLDGSAEWRVMRKIKRLINTCPTNCSIRAAYAVDGGKYWCENENGERGHVVNVVVAAGSVILESPVLPAMEGSDVTLRCRNKTTPSNLTADFYKDDFLIRTGSTGKMTIHSVSKSDEGFYKCSVSDFEESPESWLAVRVFHEETQGCPPAHLLIKTVLTSLLMTALVVIGLLHCGKLRGQCCREKKSCDVIVEDAK